MEPTKKPPVELLHVACPQDVYAEVLKILEGYDCQVERAIPAEELLDQTPWTMLRGARFREDMTQVQLAEASGIPRRHISDMEHNRRDRQAGGAQAGGSAEGRLQGIPLVARL